MLANEETIDRLNHLYLEDKIENNYIDRIRNQQHILIDIINNSPLADSIDIEKINIVYNQVVLSVQAFYKGNVQESIIHLKKFLFQQEDKKWVYLRHKRINAQELVAYRGRKIETYDLFSRTEMMHIPNHKRYLIGNQRFSFSRYPCLYMGASIYSCWEELERPDIGKFNVVCLRNEKLIHFIDLTLPHFNANDLIQSNIYTSILPWLCSFRAKRKGYTFIEEYIIPQMLMSILISSRKRGIGPIFDIMAYQGIMYTSTIYNTSKDLFKDRKIMINYVVPILGDHINAEGLCEYVCDYFSLTEPTSLTNERVIAEQGGVTMYDENKKYSKYEITEFGQLEEKLKSRDFQRI